MARAHAQKCPPPRFEFMHIHTHVQKKQHKTKADLEEAEERLREGCDALAPLVEAGLVPGACF